MTWATLGRGRLAFALLMLPAVIYVLTWRLAPALYTVWLSLTQYNIVYDAAPQLNHLENYRRIVHDRTVGPIPYLFELLHGPDVQWLGTPVTAMVGLIFSDAWEWAPLAALLLFSAMQAIPREQHDAARSDGASSWQLFFRVVLPQITG